MAARAAIARVQQDLQAVESLIISKDAQSVRECGRLVRKRNTLINLWLGTDELTMLHAVFLNWMRVSQHERLHGRLATDEQQVAVDSMRQEERLSVLHIEFEALRGQTQRDSAEAELELERLRSERMKTMQRVETLRTLVESMSEGTSCVAKLAAAKGANLKCDDDSRPDEVALADDQSVMSYSNAQSKIQLVNSLAQLLVDIDTGCAGNVVFKSRSAVAPLPIDPSWLSTGLEATSSYGSVRSSTRSLCGVTASPVMSSSRTESNPKWSPEGYMRHDTLPMPLPRQHFIGSYVQSWPPQQLEIQQPDRKSVV